MSKETHNKTKGGGWFGRHKVLCITLAGVLTVAVVGGVWWGTRRQPAGARPATNYAYVRTVTLTKTGLDQTVSTTGTVKSAATSTVSYSGGGMGSATLKVKTVHVAVGDTVTAGDVIVSLDDTDILSSIEEEQETIAERKEEAKKSLDKAQDSYDDAVADYEEMQEDLKTASREKSAASIAYNRALSSITSFQTTYDNAVELQELAGRLRNGTKATWNSATATYNDCVKEEKNAADALSAAQTALAQSPDDTALLTAVDEATVALSVAQEALQTAQVALETAEQAWNDANATYTEKVKEVQNALTELNDAKTACNYTALEQAYKTAQNSYDSIHNQMSNAESKIDSAKEQVEKAQETYDESDTSATLETLYDQLDTISLKAATNGKITALNVGVGDTPSGVIATIQDTDSLKISITVQEADINAVQLGMACRIQSDATDTVINGTLTQLDPISSQGGSFGAEVTVTDSDTGLLVGMNASVEIVLSSTEDCFSVPQDAVGNDDDGKGDYVYRSTGGSGVDMTFEKVYVTTGESNDYYIEIQADSLQEGDVIRATADLTQGIESTETEEQNANMPGGMGGFGNMGGFGGGNMPSGGNMPDFGGNGGGRPSGGGFPG